MAAGRDVVLEKGLEIVTATTDGKQFPEGVCRLLPTGAVGQELGTTESALLTVNVSFPVEPQSGSPGVPRLRMTVI
jgi:hypothetical protein